MTKTGYVIDSVTYVCRAKETVNILWDPDERAIGTNVAKFLEVTPIFPVPTGNEARLQTALQWAENPEAPKIIKKNTPFEIQICELDVRGQGGRAYKVMDSQGHYFDLREDVLLEALFSVGCQPDGKLNGKYLWVMNHTQVKLVRDGSRLHQTFKDAERRKTAEILKNSELTPGGVYRNRKDELGFFIGFAKTDAETSQISQVWLNLSSYPFQWGLTVAIGSFDVIATAKERFKSVKSTIEYLLPQKRDLRISKSHQMVELVFKAEFDLKIFSQQLPLDIRKNVADWRSSEPFDSAVNTLGYKHIIDLQFILGPIAPKLLDKEKKANKAKTETI